MSLASFKESGDIEYAADDACILLPPNAAGCSELKHLKARHTEMEDITLRADLGYMRFNLADAASPAENPTLDQARKLWDKRKPKGGAR